MGIDFGLARIGIALSDDTKFLASPYMVYKRSNYDYDIQFLIKIIKDFKVDEIVCGLPLNMQGEEQEIAKLTREFMQNIQTITQINVEYIDERLSSVMAEEYLRRTEKDWKKRKEKLDSVSASIILQDYLDYRK